MRYWEGSLHQLTAERLQWERGEVAPCASRTIQRSSRPRAVEARLRISYDLTAEIVRSRMKAVFYCDPSVWQTVNVHESRKIA